MIYGLRRFARRYPNHALFFGGVCLIMLPLCWALPSMMLHDIVRADEPGSHPLARTFLQYSTPILRSTLYWYVYRFFAVVGIAIVLAGLSGCLRPREWVNS